MLRALAKKKSPSIYSEIAAIDVETKRLSMPNCASKKKVKEVCIKLREAGLLDDFTTYAEQVAALRADAAKWPQCACGARVSMFNGHFRTFCSRACSNTSDATRKKSQETCLKRYGVSHQWAAGEHRDTMLSKYVEEHGVTPQAIGTEKRLATWKTKYGCHPMQTPVVFKKAMRSRMMLKSTMLPSGRIVELMGHEPYALEYVLQRGTWCEADFVFDQLPVIKYGKKRYFPDFWIPSHNLLIEVKSRYTAFAKRYLQDNITKEKAVKQLGYSFQLWVWDPKAKSLHVMSTFETA